MSGMYGKRPDCSDIFFRDPSKNTALYSKILEVESGRFLQKMYGSSTWEVQVRLQGLFRLLSSYTFSRPVRVLQVG